MRWGAFCGGLKCHRRAFMRTDRVLI